MRRSPVSIWISMLPIASIQSSVWNAIYVSAERMPYFLVYGFVEAVHRWKGRNYIAMAGRATPPPYGLQSRECGRLLAFATLWTCRVCPLPLANAITLPTISITGFLAVSIPKRR
jgi:hypothetical protein